ncbi:LamG-like jellyroll fold domain-containing protein [Daejeonella sp.]|uniref:LamG-like jellyroll fold domain-containing protein n=1 Tax=Daejeonella sp. TaxID=2805397 RepID=UPI0030C16BF9
MKNRISYLPLICGALILSFCSKATDVPEVQSNKAVSSPETSAIAASTYDDLVLSHNPSGYWMLTKGYQSDASGHNLTGAYFGDGRGQATLPNGETASIFNGINNYFQIPDNNLLEVTNTGILTIEAWMRPDVLNYPDTEGDGYVHWMGKGTASNHLWVARMYNANSPDRPQRISGYCFNLSGGLGAGSYFQDATSVGTWIHYTLVINTVNTSSTYPTGYTRVYKNGVLRDTDSLEGYSIIPGNGTAPMRVATRDLNSFFKGAIGKVAVYGYEVSAATLLSHNNTMRGL